MILLTLGNFTNPSWDSSVPDELHIAEAFKQAGWEVFPVQREEWHDLPDIKPDIILIAQWNGFGKETLKLLRDTYSVPIVYWAYDYQWDSNESWHFELAKDADLFLSKELDHKIDYEVMGCNFHWFTQDFAPQFLTKHPETVEKEYDVLFTGSYLPQAEFRNYLLKEVDNTFDLHIFTVTPDQWKEAGFKNVHQGIMDEGLPELYAKAKVNLSVDWKQADGYWSDRMAQIMCCGGFVINKYVFPQEIIYPFVIHFDMVGQCISSIRDALSKDESREYVGKLAHNYAQANLKVLNKVMQLTTLLRVKGLIDV